MNNGEVLARTASAEANKERLRNTTPSRSRARHALAGAGLSLIVCTAGFNALFYGQGDSIEGGRAAIGFFLFLGALVSFLAVIVVGGYLLVSRFTSTAQPTGPQDAVEFAILRSMSIGHLIGIILAWLFAIGYGSNKFEAVGFFGALIGGLVFAVATIHHFGVLDQRIEVKPHEVTVRTLSHKRTFPSESIANIAFVPSSFRQSVNAHVLLEIEDEGQLRLDGRFVSDASKAETFVSNARHILKLDTPQDGPAPPRPQDALR